MLQTDTIFETDRLIVRKLNETDADNYFDMMGNPNVMNPVPRPIMSRTESDEHLTNMMALKEGDDKKVWAVSIKGNSEFIGLVAFLTNDKEEDEIGYRFREKFWGKGFGTEITKFIIAYGFNQLKMELITADVDSRNHRSVKILEKFFNLRETFFNEEDQTIDRRYEIDKNSWKAKWS